jgi:hypothetical protein
MQTIRTFLFTARQYDKLCATLPITPTVYLQQWHLNFELRTKSSKHQQMLTSLLCYTTLTQDHMEYRNLLKLVCKIHNVNCQMQPWLWITELTLMSKVLLKKDGCSLSQKIPLISWNTKFHFYVHNSSPKIPILSYINAVHNLQTQFSILLSTPKSSKQYLPFRFSNLNFILISHPSLACYRPCHLILLDLKSANYGAYHIIFSSFLVQIFSTPSHCVLPVNTYLLHITESKVSQMTRECEISHNNTMHKNKHNSNYYKDFK